MARTTVTFPNDANRRSIEAAARLLRENSEQISTTLQTIDVRTITATARAVTEAFRPYQNALQSMNETVLAAISMPSKNVEAMSKGWRLNDTNLSAIRTAIKRLDFASFNLPTQVIQQLAQAAQAIPEIKSPAFAALAEGVLAESDAISESPEIKEAAESLLNAPDSPWRLTREAAPQILETITLLIALVVFLRTGHESALAEVVLSFTACLIALYNKLAL